MDIICIGEILVDFLPGKQLGSYIKNPGGAPANVAVAVARNGWRAGFCGKVGNDEFGRFLIDSLRENGVIPLCEKACESAVTTMAFVNLEEDGERSFTFVRKPGADMFLCMDDIKQICFESAKIVHAGSCSLSAPSARQATEYAMYLAHKKGKLVSFDVNYRDAMWGANHSLAKDAVKRVLPMVDLLKVSQEEATLISGGKSLVALAQKYQITCVVETMGAKGATCYYNGQKLFSPAIPTDCVDATGAGDAFWGAFLSVFLSRDIQHTTQISEELLNEALVYANAAGSLAIQKKGAIPALPRKNEIVSHLAAAER